MKIIGICASPRRQKTTHHALTVALEAAAATGAQTSLIELAGKKFNGCVACGQCLKRPVCSLDDELSPIVQALDDPQLGGIIFATPVYFGGMSSQGKAFWDRCVLLRRNGFRLADKVGGAIAVGGFRNGGQETTIAQVHAAMLVHGMVVVSEGPPTSHFGGTCCSGGEGGIQADEFGLATARALGQRVATLAARLHRD